MLLFSRFQYWLLLLMLRTMVVQTSPIVGGHAVDYLNPEAAALAKYPYMVSLQDLVMDTTKSHINTMSATINHTNIVFQHFCGGSLVHSLWILTAEHCLRRKDKQRIVAVVGCFTDISDVAYHERRVIERVEFVQNRNIVNDIALVRLLHAIELPSNAYAQLPLPGMKVDRRNACRIIGYGATHYGGKVQKQLFEGKVHIITKRTCRQSLGLWAPTYHDPTICAVGKDQDTCQGDSGGPMLCGDEGMPYVVGIVSHGPTCGMSGVPSIYTVVFPFLDWIYNTIATQQ